MRKIVEESSVVIAGYWNPSIIVPEWINHYLRAGSDQNVGITLQLGNPTSPVIYEFDNINLKVRADRIEFVPTDTDACKLAVLKAVQAIVSELKHTPVQAIGVNFVYQEESPEESLMGIFLINDPHQIADLPIILNYPQVIRKISFNDCKDFELIFSASLNDNGMVKLEFNFNQNISKLDEVNNFIERGIAFYEQKVQEILAIYSQN